VKCIQRVACAAPGVHLPQPWSVAGPLVAAITPPPVLSASPYNATSSRSAPQAVMCEIRVSLLIQDVQVGTPVFGAFATCDDLACYLGSALPRWPYGRLRDQGGKEMWMETTTHGESPLKGAIIGSTPYKLVQLSDRPLLVVRA